MYLIVMWSSQAVCQVERLTTDSLADVFPLSVGNQWTYRYYLFWQNWPSGNPGETCVDSGSAVCEVAGYVRTPDSTVWQIHQRRDIVRHDVIDSLTGRPLDTTYAIQDTSSFEFIESHEGQHQLYRNADPYLVLHEVFPFTREYVDSALINRFAYVDAGDTLAFRSWLDAFHGQYFIFTFKEDVGLVYNFYNSGTVDAYSTHEHVLITSIINSVTYPSRSEPGPFTLLQNYPNPFNPRTAISVTATARNHGSLRVLDVLGREVSKLWEGMLIPGTVTVSWNASDVASGIYFCQLRAGPYVQTRKMTLIK
jgi:hypothetical protein